MASLFTQIAAGLTDVPAIDPRLMTHVEILAVVTERETQALLEQGLVAEEQPIAPDAQ